MEQEILKKIREEKLIAIIRGVRSSDIIETVNALYDGGIKNVEITFDHECRNGIEETLLKIRTVKQVFGNAVNVGAGTVLSARDVHLAAEAGAEYMISPDTNPAVIRKTKELGKVSIPGALTPSEICMAFDSGADIVKLFPAGIFGTEYVKAIRAPLPHIPICIVGDVTPESIQEFRNIGIDCFGVGGNLVSEKLVENRKFEQIRETARKYCMAVSERG